MFSTDLIIQAMRFITIIGLLTGVFIVGMGAYRFFLAYKDPLNQFSRMVISVVGILVGVALLIINGAFIMSVQASIDSLAQFVGAEDETTKLIVAAFTLFILFMGLGTGSLAGYRVVRLLAQPKREIGKMLMAAVASVFGYIIVAGGIAFTKFQISSLQAIAEGMKVI